jgi:hypothetical protein
LPYLPPDDFYDDDADEFFPTREELLREAVRLLTIAAAPYVDNFDDCD